MPDDDKKTPDQPLGNQGASELDLKPLEDSTMEETSGAPPLSVEEERLDAVYDVPVKVSAVLGHAEMQVNQLLKLGRGAVIELDRKIGEAIDIYVNNRLVARGEVIVVNDHLGITMTEIVKSDRTGS